MCSQLDDGCKRITRPVAGLPDGLRPGRAIHVMARLRQTILPSLRQVVVESGQVVAPLILAFGKLTVLFLRQVVVEGGQVVAPLILAFGKLTVQLATSITAWCQARATAWPPSASDREAALTDARRLLADKLTFAGQQLSNVQLRLREHLRAPFDRVTQIEPAIPQGERGFTRPRHWDHRWSERRVWSRPATRSKTSHPSLDEDVAISDQSAMR